MKFIPVISKINEDTIYEPISAANIRVANSCLFSLYDAFDTQEFGLKSLYNTRKKLEKLKVKFIDPVNAELFIDSGGYAQIRGLIHESDLVNMIECYVTYIEKEYENFNYVFTLDLPWSIKYRLYNTKEKVYKYNQLSLFKTFKLVEKIPLMADKLHFIWQFRKKGQYEIWNKLYNELTEKGYTKHIKCRAIGGMVGLKGQTGINFSSFIAPAFRCFKDYLVNGVFDYDFKLHLLGIYTLTDRFIIAFIEDLFTKYLEIESFDVKAAISYDSINYNLDGNYNARKIQVYDFNNGNLFNYTNVNDVPDEIIKEIYYHEKYDLYEHINKEFQCLKDNKRLNNVSSFIPLNLHSFISIDKYFMNIIKQHDLIAIMINSPNRKSFIGEIEDQLNKIKKEQKHVFKNFTKNFISSTLSSMSKLYTLHKWYTKDGANYESLHSIIKEHVKTVGDPGELI